MKKQLHTYKEWQNKGYQVKKGQRSQGIRYGSHLYSSDQVYRKRRSGDRGTEKSATHIPLNRAAISILTITIITIGRYFIRSIY